MVKEGLLEEEAFTRALGDWRIRSDGAEVLWAETTVASREWRQERRKWYLREIM